MLSFRYGFCGLPNAGSFSTSIVSVVYWATAASGLCGGDPETRWPGDYKPIVFFLFALLGVLLSLSLYIIIIYYFYYDYYYYDYIFCLVVFFVAVAVVVVVVVAGHPGILRHPIPGDPMIFRLISIYIINTINDILYTSNYNSYYRSL